MEGWGWGGDRYSMVRWWIFSIALTLWREKKAGCRNAATVLLKNLMERDRDSSPEAPHWFDRQLHRENVSQHLKPCNFNKTFRIYQHISLLLFMRKLAFGSTWHSHQSCMIFTRIPWTAFACEEQSLLLFHKIISIRPCCWVRSLWKSLKIGHCKKETASSMVLMCLFLVLQNVQLNYPPASHQFQQIYSCLQNGISGSVFIITSHWLYLLWLPCKLFCWEPETHEKHI